MTAATVEVLALIPAAYLVGSVPFGLIVGLARGIDPRKAGSGNIGATNLGRLLGGKFFAIVFTLDLLKGLLPTLAAGAVLRFNAPDWTFNALWLTVALATIVGHMFSVFIGFKGGKGVATSAGVIFGVFPYYTLAAVPAVLAFLIAFKLSRYVSVASILGATGFTLAYVTIGLIRGWPMLGTQLPLLGFAVLVFALIIFKHRGNIVRLWNGTELRFGANRVQESLAATSPTSAVSAASLQQDEPPSNEVGGTPASGSRLCATCGRAVDRAGPYCSRCGNRMAPLA